MKKMNLISEWIWGALCLGINIIYWGNYYRKGGSKSMYKNSKKRGYSSYEKQYVIYIFFNNINKRYI